MEQVVSFVALSFTSLFGIAALVVVGIGVYWLFNKKAKQKQLAELRAKYEQMKPADPEYNQVRALYTSMMIDAHRWEFSHGLDTAGTGSSHHSDSGSHSSGDSGGGGDGH